LSSRRRKEAHPIPERSMMYIGTHYRPLPLHYPKDNLESRPHSC
jgi:hypothetical protein